jgi:hypothetical protein
LNDQLTRASTLATPAATSPLISNILHTTGVSISLFFKIPTSNSNIQYYTMRHYLALLKPVTNLYKDELQEIRAYLLSIGQQFSTVPTVGFLEQKNKEKIRAEFCKFLT